MCPKAKADTVTTHRIEFQETEREALDMVAASLAIKNIGAGVGNIISPFLTMSAAGGVLLSTILAAYAAKSVADEVLDTVNPNAPGGLTTRIGTSSWFVGFTADVKRGIDTLIFNNDIT
jgi:hypothetical protein